MIKNAYTQEEIDIIINEVKKSPNNLLRAFNRASKKIQRSATAIAAKWHGDLKKKSEMKDMQYVPLRKYTQEDIDVIINEVKNYPTNLEYAFNQAAVKIERSALSIRNKWYTHIKKQYDAITCGSAKGFTKNVKNVFRDDDDNLPDQGLKHYLYIVKELLDLPDQERKLVINLFTGNTIIKQ